MPSHTQPVKPKINTLTWLPWLTSFVDSTHSSFVIAVLIVLKHYFISIENTAKFMLCTIYDGDTREVLILKGSGTYILSFSPQLFLLSFFIRSLNNAHKNESDYNLTQ